ncbi:hypothetical protein B0I35DRAFT_440440 [Stachybotrys elegans]|uniref:Apple domain-containing protein n=1 Tax=Stachybotrys elegans TaxID=80388 RepID=A0A8K0WLV2_9HYPO|nr:hypothetical protein B0I35DRAFT_440440 [Stachybotrys elegans]
MRFTTTILALLLAASATIASPAEPRAPPGPNQNIFPPFNTYSNWAICRGRITKGRFPTLQAPNGAGGCVRYYQGIDITGVVTELHFFFKDGFRTACDCAAKCLEQSNTCTNWVWKHTFMPGDGGRRSCTLYSSPNLPPGVTLAYNLQTSKGFLPLQAGNNPQAGAPAPLTTLDKAGNRPDRFGVSGFIMKDANGRLFC